ncbi:MAG: hypothetical protein U0641_13745 [Anaerolineae bacterium]
MIIVNVVDSRGNPVRGARVHISWRGGWMGSVSDERTDSNGRAYFRWESGSGTILVDGQEVFDGYIQGEITVLYRY